MSVTKVKVHSPLFLPHRNVQDVSKKMICVEPVSNHTLSGHSSPSHTHDISMSAEDEVQTKSERTKRRRREKSDGSAVVKVCAICGDHARNTHFGGVCCDSCKAFFRRAVQSNSYHKFYCSANKNCPIVKCRRRQCQYCRFQKCHRIGMEVGLVMTEAERIALWKKKLAKRRSSSPKTDFDSVANCQLVRVASLPGTLPDRNCFKGATPEEVATLGHLVTLQQLMFSSLPYPENCFGNTPETLANLFFHICFKIRSLFYSMDDFQDIPKEDQVCILRNGIAMSIYIHGAHNYDSINQRWPASGISEALRLPNITKETVKMFTLFPELYISLMDFYNKYGEDMKDEAVVVLLSLIALFHDRNEMLIAKERIHMLNNKYITLLRNYLVSKHGYEEGNAALNKLLLSLLEIKKVVAFHCKVDVKPSIENHPSSSNGTTVHFQAQLTALAEAFRGKSLGGFPEYASPFTLEEKKELEFSQTFLELSLPRSEVLLTPKPDNCSNHSHHAFTKSIFGEESNTSTILSLSNIFDCNRISEVLIEKNSFPQSSSNITFHKNNLARISQGEKENGLKVL